MGLHATRRATGAPDGIMLLPWEQFLDRLWDGKLAGAA